jgi:nitrite reductase/ring-hydroxylating ferredoxin subunit
MAWYQVASRDEIAPGQPKIVDVGGKSIGVFHEGGRYYAILNHCPHFGAPVCRGKVFGAVTSKEPGQQSYDETRPILRCPWHHWEFDMETGRALTPIKQRLKTYNVAVGESEDDTASDCDGNGVVSVTKFSVQLQGDAIWIEV